MKTRFDHRLLSYWTSRPINSFICSGGGRKTLSTLSDFIQRLMYCRLPPPIFHDEESLDCEWKTAFKERSTMRYSNYDDLKPDFFQKDYCRLLPTLHRIKTSNVGHEMKRLFEITKKEEGSCFILGAQENCGKKAKSKSRTNPIV